MTPSKPALEPRDLADLAARYALEKKATDVLVMDLRKSTSVCDYFVLASGDSEPQVKAIVDRVEEGLRESGESPWHVEGLSGKHWVLMDYVDVVVHVFTRETREFYMLERLWSDAPREVVEGEPGNP